MAPPPAKRQKRNVVLSSEDEELPTPASKLRAPNRAPTKENSNNTKSHGVEKRSLPTRSGAKEKDFSKQRPLAPPQPSPTSSPERRSRKTVSKAPANGSLQSFFNKTRKRQPAKKEPRIENVPPAEEVEEDIIEDDSADEPSRVQKTVGASGKVESTRKVLDRRKPLREQTQSVTATACQEKPISASQRFLAVGRASSTEASTQTTSTERILDNRPWAEKFGPVDLGELMVHKKKVADVRGWLEGTLQGRYHQRLLILKGPSGAGKTATVSALAKAIGMDISEWKNPVDTDFSSGSYVSMSAQFEDFLGRSARFGSLIFSDDGSKPHPEPSKHPPPPSGDYRKKLILMEEFPNTFTSTSLALRSFRTSVLQYLASNALSPASYKSPPTNVRPLIMIITETTTSTTSSDSFTAHRLLGPTILSHPATTTIEFNPMAPTLLQKALEIVVQKQARHSLRRLISGPAVLEQLAEIGDVRSAIGSLEFLCMRGGDNEDWSGHVASKSKKGNGTAMSKMEQHSLELVSQREMTLGLFHAVGKVVYNKRQAPTATNRPAQPPEHLPQHTRLKASEVSLDTLIDETGTDPRIFIAALHENYVPSCEGSAFTNHLNDCIDALSDADLLTADHSGWGQYTGKIAEELRQEEIAFHVSVRGLLFSLPHPVKRASHPVKGAKSGMEAFKMRYPMSMRLARQIEETEELVERWSSRAAFTNQGEDSARARSATCSEELLLERLPYVAKIERQRGPSRHGSELEKITTFHGISTASEEDDELVDEAKRDQVLMPPPAASGLGKAKESLDAGMQLDDGVEKLYLSDDDIEDG